VVVAAAAMAVEETGATGTGETAVDAATGAIGEVVRIAEVGGETASKNQAQGLDRCGTMF